MLKKSQYYIGLFFLFLSFSVCAREFKMGIWRFELKLPYATVPFLVDFYHTGSVWETKILNAKETIPVEMKINGNNISIPISNYEISLELTMNNRREFEGHLVRHNKNPIVKFPVKAYFYGHKERYPGVMYKTPFNLTGRWELQLENTDGKKNPAVGIFTQEGGYVTGTLLTPTGDYRYMEGFASAENFELASFDGVYNYVLRGTVKNGKMDASLLSTTINLVTGTKNPKAKLPSGYSQTKLHTLKFIFPDLEGKHVNLNHPKFKDKPVIVQIFGSWCPNCIDEMNYLVPWYNENSKRGIEIIALAFERSLGIDEAKRQLMKTRDKYKVPYTILQAGSTSEDKPAEKIAGIQNFISFPTTIYLNRKHQVIKVHAGFNGPSTGPFFEAWKKDFHNITEYLLKP